MGAVVGCVMEAILAYFWVFQKNQIKEKKTPARRAGVEN
jgi:hypothetical protein